ncbi:MAG: hypothetical protein ACD_40C00048G0002 [uncultured bacterium]|nr:MAG: hypothetical protein ACD_40C00048G0002 [uncultured bacterium]
MSHQIDPALVIGSRERETAFRSLNDLSTRTIIHPAEPPYNEWFESTTVIDLSIREVEEKYLYLMSVARSMT